MSESVETTEPVVDDAQVSDGATEAAEVDTETSEPEGSESLGDAGKKALNAMKEREKAARAKARKAEEEVESLRRQIEDQNKTPDEQAIDAAKREATAEATAKANARILKSEVKAAAAGKLSDPGDAIRFLNLDEFEVDEDGNVDSEQLSDAISDLLKSKPYLAAQGGAVQFDSARGKKSPDQLTEADLKGKSPEWIAAAKEAGRLDSLLGRR